MHVKRETVRRDADRKGLQALDDVIERLEKMLDNWPESYYEKRTASKDQRSHPEQLDVPQA